MTGIHFYVRGASQPILGRYIDIKLDGYFDSKLCEAEPVIAIPRSVMIVLKEIIKYSGSEEKPEIFYKTCPVKLTRLDIDDWIIDVDPVHNAWDYRFVNLFGVNGETDMEMKSLLWLDRPLSLWKQDFQQKFTTIQDATLYRQIVRAVDLSDCNSRVLLLGCQVDENVLMGCNEPVGEDFNLYQPLLLHNPNLLRVSLLVHLSSNIQVVAVLELEVT